VKSSLDAQPVRDAANLAGARKAEGDEWS